MYLIIEMKLDNSINNKDSEANRKMMNREKSIDGSGQNNTNNSSNNPKRNDTNSNEKQLKQQEKLQKEREKQLEKERKEREKKEKERLEKEKKQQKNSSNLNSSITSGDINKLSRQAIQQGDTSQTNTSIPQSKSENMLSRLKKQTSLFGDKNKKEKNAEPPVISAPQPSNQTIQLQPQNQMPEVPSLISQPKGRYRCQVIYLDESVKTFDIDVSLKVE